MVRKTAKTASYIQSTPGVVGGRARVRNTRIPVWSLVSLRSLGASDGELLRNFPTLTQEDLDAAWRYYEQHRAEIDWDIEDQDIEDEASA